MNGATRFHLLRGTVGAAVIALAWTSPSWAIVYTTSGTISGQDVSARARITLSTDSNNKTTMTIVLTNTTSGGTQALGSALTGITFDYDSNGKNSSPGLTWNRVTLTNSNDRIFTSDAKGKFKKSDSGSISKWKVDGTGTFSVKTGGPRQYGIVAAQTFPRDPDPNFKSSSFVQNSLTITLDVSGTLKLSRITNVRFLFGKGGSLTASVPEPSGLAIVGISALGLAGYRLRRRAS